MKTILDKINKAYEIEASKVELGTHEVELGLVQDILVEYKKGKNNRTFVSVSPIEISA